MAGGEKAKSSGEYGEKIVKNLLELIGWEGLDEGVTIKCQYNEAHSKGEKNQRNMALIIYININLC